MAVAVVQRHVHFAVTHYSLNHGRVLLIIHQEGRNGVLSEDVEPKPLLRLTIPVKSHVRERRSGKPSKLVHVLSGS